MHASGKCPVCSNTVALSAAFCPQCGNTKFSIKTGRKLGYVCKCEGAGCDICDWKGVVYSDQWADSRDLDSARKSADENERTQRGAREKALKAKADREKREKEIEILRKDSERGKNYREVLGLGRASIVGGFFLGILSYFVVGLGGCVYRIIDDPWRRRGIFDEYYYKSWSEEAVVVSLAIVGIGFAIAILILIWAAVNHRKA